MALHAYNKTGAPLVLGLGGPPPPLPTLPASPAPPLRGPAVNVTSECTPDITLDPAHGIPGGLLAPHYAAILAQIGASFVDLEWTDDAEYTTIAPLDAAVGGPAPGPHASTHTTGSTDPLIVVAAAANTSVGQSNISHHETFLAPEAQGTSKGTIDDDSTTANPTGQPTHPANLEVVFPAGWLGGTITVFGILVDGLAGSEVFTDTSGGAGGTEIGSKAFAKITTPAGIVNNAPGGIGATTATVQIGAKLGAAAGVNPFEFYKLATDSLDEAIFASDGVNGTFTPTTAKNGAHDYEIWYRYLHGHGTSDPNHTHTLS